MNRNQRGRALIRLGFWAAVAVAIFAFAISSYLSGEMRSWYYYTAATSGYAIDDNAFLHATQANPVLVAIVQSDKLQGAQAVKVKKGDRLPAGANGVIADKDVSDGKRVALEGSNLKIMVPSQVKEQSGVKYNDTYRHKGIETNPWSGPWNVGVVLIMGLSLGMLAQAVTDALGFVPKAQGKALAH